MLTLNFLCLQSSPSAAWLGVPSIGWDSCWDGSSSPVVPGCLCLCCKIRSCCWSRRHFPYSPFSCSAEGEGSNRSLMLRWLSHHLEVVSCIISTCRSSTQTRFAGLEAAPSQTTGEKLPCACSLPHKRGLIFLAISILQHPLCKKDAPSQPTGQISSEN